MNFIDTSDLPHKDELLTEIKDVLLTFGPLESLKLLTSPRIPVVRASFVDPSEALAAYNALYGMQIEGRPMRLELYNDNFTDLYEPHVVPNTVRRTSLLSAASATSPHRGEQISSADVAKALSASNSSHKYTESHTDTLRITPSTTDQTPVELTLYLENILSEDDVANPSDAQELLTDIQALCSPYTADGAGVSSVWIEKRKLEKAYERNYKTLLGDRSLYSYQPHTSPPSSSSAAAAGARRLDSSASRWTFIEFYDLEHALACLEHLSHDQKSLYHAYYYDYSAYLSQDYRDTFLIDPGLASNLTGHGKTSGIGRPSIQPKRRHSFVGSIKKRFSLSLGGDSAAESPERQSFMEDNSYEAPTTFALLLYDFVPASSVVDATKRETVFAEINRVLHIQPRPPSPTAESHGAETTPPTTRLSSQSDASNFDRVSDTPEISFWDHVHCTSEYDKAVVVAASHKTSNGDDKLVHILVTFPSLLECCQALNQLGEYVIGTDVIADIVKVHSNVTTFYPSDPLGGELAYTMVHRGESCGAVVALKDTTHESDGSSYELSGVDLEIYKEKVLHHYMVASQYDEAHVSSLIRRVSVLPSEIPYMPSLLPVHAIVACVSFKADRGSDALLAMIHFDGLAIALRAVPVHAYLDTPHNSTPHPPHSSPHSSSDVLVSTDSHYSHDDDQKSGSDESPKKGNRRHSFVSPRKNANRSHSTSPGRPPLRPPSPVTAATPSSPKSFIYDVLEIRHMASHLSVNSHASPRVDKRDSTSEMASEKDIVILGISAQRSSRRLAAGLTPVSSNVGHRLSMETYSPASHRNINSFSPMGHATLKRGSLNKLAFGQHIPVSIIYIF